MDKDPAMMHQLGLENPFGTPIYHIDETTSTMDEARRLTAAAINTAAGSGAEAPARYNYSLL